MNIGRDLAIVAVLFLAATAGNTTTILVPSEQPTIQAGINVVSEGDTVLVAPGMYTGDGNRDIDFGGKNLVLMSESGPETTIIECEGSHDDPHRGFYFHNGEDSTTVVDGFTIQGGDWDNGWDAYGGGIYCDGSSPTFVNCWIKDNKALAPTYPAIIGAGGGAYCRFASPTFVNCVFTDNWASESVGWGFGGGGAIACVGSSPHLIGCTFSGNRGHIYSGTLLCDYYSSPVLTNCILAFGSRKAVHCEDAGSHPTLNCCNIYGHEGGDWYGYIADQEDVNGNFSADPMFCDTAAGNLRLQYGSPCLPANNTSGQLVGALSAPCLPCCTLRGDVDDDGAGPNITDLIFLVRFMFQQGPEPSCMDATDVNGNGTETPDITDLIYLVTFMFQQGPAPVPCP
jgi:hypothetical protein